ncbi:carbonic anhydrase [Desulfosediminicola flagellatus]|uniref:carbonic anhydrase n=1 Tax=Desulfosediminicola flagellatus TaxID=2569541 RepID=UPI0010AD3F5C|nr:carbonic anhydrase [Desulfosediminicola flagellatus]
MGQENSTRPTAEDVLKTLKEGNLRFVNGNLEHPNHCEESRQILALGQEPIATVLTCADSRVPPVDIFDQGLGHLFVVRVAGNIIGDHSLGSIEYAVKHLHTPLVIVMGHTSCGAVSAVASGAALEGHIATLGPAIQTAIKSVEETSGDLVNNASKELARQIAKKIAESEPIVADLVKAGKVKVVPAFYDLHTGKVIFLDT